MGSKYKIINKVKMTRLTITPANNTDESTVIDQWATTVTLARIATRFVHITSTDHLGCDRTRTVVVITFRVGKDGQANWFKIVGTRTTFPGSAPTRSKGIYTYWILTGTSQTDWFNNTVIGQWRFQCQDREIVVGGWRVVTSMLIAVKREDNQMY